MKLWSKAQIMIESDLYKDAPLSSKIQIMVDLKHDSLESGADANVELFKYLIPAAIDELKQISK